MRNRNKMRMNRERDGMSEKNLLTPTGASAKVGGGDDGWMMCLCFSEDQAVLVISY